MDVILAFPQIMLALVALVTLGAQSWLLILAVGLTTMPRVARVVRGAAQPIVERDFVAAADALGVPRWRILFSEVLPNVMSPLMVETSLRLTYAIALVASLAFLGFTPNPTGADWGLMIFENRVALSVQPWGVMLPIIAIGLLTLGTGLIGDGIARAAAGIELLGHCRRGVEIAGGSIRVGDIEVLELKGDDRRKFRGRVVSYVPQDPAASLNPALRIGTQLREVLDVHGYGENDTARTER